MEGGKEQLISGTRMVGTKKSLGQHWLKNRAILEEIADLASEGGAWDGFDRTEVKTRAGSAEPVSDKTGAKLCVEIGPGLGFLTSSLLRRFEKVIAVEYDDRLAENLPKSFPGKNLEVVHEDVLEYDFGMLNEPYVVAGNIPYYITSPIIEKVLTVPRLPEKVVLLVQKEVAERILSDKETLLSLFVKNRAIVSAGPVVPAREFTPPPKVDSEVIVMEPHAPVVGDAVFELMRRGFMAPRKKLVHNLVGMKSREELVSVLTSLGISLDARPGDLKLEAWQELHDALK